MGYQTIRSKTGKFLCRYDKEHLTIETKQGDRVTEYRIDETTHDLSVVSFDANAPPLTTTRQAGNNQDTV